MSHICVHKSVEYHMTHFLHKSSPKICRESLKEEASMRIMEFLQKTIKHYLAKQKLKEIVQPSTSKSLIEMSRLDFTHRQKKPKLRNQPQTQTPPGTLA